MPKSKLQKAQRLVELTESGLPERKFGSSAPKMHVDFRRTLEEDSRKLQAELKAKYYTNEQLDVLLEFYESEMGKSILEAGKLVRAEFSERFKELGARASKLDDDQKLGELRLKITKRKNRNDDT